MATKRTKGGAFERFVATTLSTWWSEGEHDDLCWRTSGSGGRSTVRSKKQKRTLNHYGDIGRSSDEMKPFFDVFCLECKFGYSTTSPYDSLDSKKSIGQLGKWWKKNEKKRKQAGSKYSMIIWRRNGRKDIVIVPYKLMMKTSWASLFMCSFAHISAHGMDLIMVPFDEFVEYISPDDVRRLIRA